MHTKNKRPVRGILGFSQKTSLCIVQPKLLRACVTEKVAHCRRCVVGRIHPVTRREGASQTRAGELLVKTIVREERAEVRREGKGS